MEREEGKSKMGGTEKTMRGRRRRQERGWQGIRRQGRGRHGERGEENQMGRKRRGSMGESNSVARLGDFQPI